MCVSFHGARCGQKALGVAAPWAFAFLPQIQPPSVGGLRPEARRYSFGSLALSIFSRTQGAPPRRFNFSFCASESLIVTGEVAGAPTVVGFLPPPGRGPPHVRFSLFMLAMVHLTILFWCTFAHGKPSPDKRPQTSRMTAFQKLRRSIMSRKEKVRKPWTEEEISRMVELSKTKTSAQVGALLGRSMKSIVNKLRSIRTKAAPQARWLRQWSEEDRETLRRMWPDHTKQEVAAALGRHVSHVVSYAHYMGLRVSEQQRLAKGWQRMDRRGSSYTPWTRAQADELLRLLETCSLGNIALITGRSLDSVRLMCRALKKGTWSPSGYRAWSEREKETLRLMWPDHSLAEVAAALDRSEKSVATRVTKLRLRKSATYLILLNQSAKNAYPPELRECIQLAKQIERKLGDRQDHRQPA